MQQTNHLTLGRLVTPQGQHTSDLLQYPLNHLTTHALLLGATGSGKTGLGLVLVEEVLRQGVPVLLLDVKGDLSNLLLTFPDLNPQDFAPWIDEETAQRRGISTAAAAAAIAAERQSALAEWGLSAEQITHLRETVDLSLYTPGLRAGQPVDILSHFGTPPQDSNESALRAQGFASALLSLAGIEADPLQSREHILLTNLIQHRWTAGEALDIPTLIQMVQHPPMHNIGVFDMENFFPQKDRFTLALTLNNLIAAPGFALWHEGEPLNIDRFLWTAEGKPRASIFYLAHLPEDQRRFFITLFLEELRTWIRHQGGTKALRALLVFDEIYGYLPPHPHNPPTKAPLIALVKQGRAAGLGILLSTQNPGDVDYKGLSNIGTWFVGALRAERDKERILEAMEGTLAKSGMHVRDVERSLSGLATRRFLMHDARDGTVNFFQSRASMSYLRGPLTTVEVQQLVTPTQDVPEQAPAAPPQASPATTPAKATAPQQAPFLPKQTSLPISQALTERPASIAPDIPQVFLPATITASWALQAHAEKSGLSLPDNARPILIHRPYLLGVGTVHLLQEKSNVHITDQQVWRISGKSEQWAMHWDEGAMLDLRMEDLTSAPPAEGWFAPLPNVFGDKSAYKKWESDLKAHIYRNTQIRIWKCTPLKLQSSPGEAKPTFLRHCRKKMEAQLAAALDAEEVKFRKKAAKIEKKLRREELELDQDEMELSERKREELLSGAETVLGIFSRRIRSRALSQTSRQRRYVKKAESDVEESVETIKIYHEEIEELEAAWETRQEAITQEYKKALTQIQSITVRAHKQDIDIRFCGLAWFPFWEIDFDNQHIMLPAYIPQGI